MSRTDRVWPVRICHRGAGVDRESADLHGAPEDPGVELVSRAADGCQSSRRSGIYAVKGRQARGSRDRASSFVIIVLLLSARPSSGGPILLHVVCRDDRSAMGLGTVFATLLCKCCVVCGRICCTRTLRSLYAWYVICRSSKDDFLSSSVLVLCLTIGCSPTDEDFLCECRYQSKVRRQMFRSQANPNHVF